MGQHTVEYVAQIVSMTNAAHLMAAQHYPDSITKLGIVIEAVQVCGGTRLAESSQCSAVNRVPELPVGAQFQELHHVGLVAGFIAKISLF